MVKRMKVIVTVVIMGLKALVFCNNSASKQLIFANFLSRACLRVSNSSYTRSNTGALLSTSEKLVSKIKN